MESEKKEEPLPIVAERMPAAKATVMQEEHGAYLAIGCGVPLRTLNSSVWGSGFGTVRHLVNRQVPLDYPCEDVQADMEQFLLETGFRPTETAAMLTAARVADAGESHLRCADLYVSAWATVGLGNTARAGTAEGVDRFYPGTINIMIVVDGRLTDGAMVNAILTATEAKVAALQDEAVTARNSTLLATGTTTDAVLIASTGRGTLRTYSGTATIVGHMIGKTVYNAVRQAVQTYREWQQA